MTDRPQRGTQIAQYLQNPETLNNAVRAIGGFFGRATQPAQDLGSWAVDPIRQQLRNPFQGQRPVQPRAQLPGQRATFFGNR